MKGTPNTILDPLTGEIKISDQLVISKSIKPDDLFTYYKTNEIEIWDVQNGFVHYTVRIIESQNQYFFFSFCFLGDKFNMLTFGFKDQPGMLSWEDWSEAKEIQNKIAYDH